MSKIDARRGHIYRVDTGDGGAPLLCLVISVNALNAERARYITLLITPDRNAPAGMPDWVRLSAGDPVFGHAICGDIGMVYQEQLIGDLGEISMETQLKVNQALKRTLGL